MIEIYLFGKGIGISKLNVTSSIPFTEGENIEVHDDNGTPTTFTVKEIAKAIFQDEKLPRMVVNVYLKPITT